MDLSLTCNRHNPILTPWVVSPRCSRKLVWTGLISFSSILFSCPVFWFTLLCSLLPNSHLKTKIYSFPFCCVLICVVPSWLYQREDDYTKVAIAMPERRWLYQHKDVFASLKTCCSTVQLQGWYNKNSSIKNRKSQMKLAKCSWLSGLNVKSIPSPFTLLLSLHQPRGNIQSPCRQALLHSPSDNFGLRQVEHLYISTGGMLWCILIHESLLYFISF